MSVKIIGLRMADGFDGRDGFRVIAFFDCTIHDGILLKGCKLTRTPKGGLTASAPSFLGEDGRRGVTITSDSLRHQMMESARAVYRAFGGTEAEWIPAAEREAVASELSQGESRR